MTNKDWIKLKILENGLTRKQISELYDEFIKEQNSTMARSSYERRIAEVISQIEIDDLEDVDLSNEELTDKLVRMSAQKQRIQDTKNHEVKIKREYERLYNILDVQFSNLIGLLEKYEIGKVKLPPIKKDRTKKYGVLQLSDHHWNEIILPQETHGLNSFDFEIGSKRLRKFILEAIEEFKNNNVTDVYITMTGDMINSSRRLSEKLAQSTSLSKASLLVVHLFEQAFIELRKAGFKLYITSIVGNESRLPEDMESNELTASENWDFLIFNSLRHMLRKTDGIEFIMPDNQIMSLVKLPNGFNFLITHGHTVKGDLDKSIGKLLQNYIYQGLSVNMVLTGHYHSAHISDFACRSSSLCGGNAYSSNDLLFLSRASQNIYIINSDKSFKGIKIDVQNIDNIIGYDVISELESYTSNNSNKATMRIISEILA